MVKKLNRLEVEEKLKSLNLLIFTPREFKDVFGVKKNTASLFIKRNLKSGLFIKLRNGFYVLADSNPSHYLLANKLYQPSYISLEKALSHYGIIPETVYSITSVTTKPTREFKTPKGIFSYQRLKKEAFMGYEPKKMEGMTIFFAEPEKALADYLYFVDLKKISLNDRLDLKNIKKTRLLTFIRLFRRKSLFKLVEQIYVEQRKPRKIY
jgi:predicted transcriptional regulator of viral defense system